MPYSDFLFCQFTWVHTTSCMGSLIYQPCIFLPDCKEHNYVNSCCHQQQLSEWNPNPGILVLYTSYCLLRNMKTPAKRVFQIIITTLNSCSIKSKSVKGLKRTKRATKSSFCGEIAGLGQSHGRGGGKLSKRFFFDGFM